jgi:DNA repair protein RecO (recombination protein O)
MLHKTKGIVLHSIKYSETSLIVRIYTELFGLQSYLVKGARSAKSKLKPVLFQPLTLLDLVVYRKEKSSLQSIREIQISIPYQTIPFDIRKSTIALYLDEILYKAVREEEPNPELFEFLWNSFQMLDTMEGPFSGFHLVFTIKLTRFLGFYPGENEDAAGRLFNLREGIFLDSIPEYEQALDQQDTALLRRLMKCTMDQPTDPGFTSGERNRMLDVLLRYYQLHLPGFQGFRSHEILRQVLS